MTERGSVLLEVLVALLVLSLTGTAAIAAVRAALDHVERVQRAERVVADADRLLTAYALLTRDDLVGRIGERTVGPWTVDVRWQDLDLFGVTVRGLAGLEIWTSLYRPRPALEVER